MNGSAVALVTGGIPNYTISFTDPSTNDTIYFYTDGDYLRYDGFLGYVTYFIYAEDSLGCQSDPSIVGLGQPRMNTEVG